MSKLTETLKAAGWVETTLGECQVEEEVLLTPAGPFPRVMRLVQPPEWGGEKRRFVNTSDGRARLGTLPVLRAPRSECAPGTVALITWDGQDKPMRAMRLNQDWTTVDDGYVLEGSAKVVRVLLPADQDTPPVEVTDEMVSAALNRLINESVLREFEWQDDVEATRAALAAALEAALEVNA